MPTRAKLAVALTCIVIAAGACSSPTTGAASAPPATATPTPTPTPTTVTAVEYGTLTDLRDAAVAAGYTCSDWTQDDVVTNAAESGTCSTADVFTTYATSESLQAQVELTKENNQLFRDNDLGVDPTLVGPNWMINGKESEVLPLQKAMGGRILR